ncbi:uncharacterized protein BDW43DRAFT_270431 [Aspergillus alliaceus]|uniref:uncharacterized protein n=1 Tax=Petromyces alliaceus TaxID=209559 RepID=UPI0012A53E76|nr:uncharacterized protein BDW43DRAFT_270431 [Aspergillus alliaceus]KAB8235501.1 hypothetical protein BDW43DRAFT_270431 [Aspergillus alliaceus]
MAAAQLPTGSISTGLPANEEVQEYEKILKISDDIFTGTHPRLKVPQQFVRKPAPRNPPASTQTQVKTIERPGSSTWNAPQPVPTPSKPSSALGTTAPDGLSSTTGSSRIVPKPTSEIDPIFLTKSDDLVRAELQLQRQRVERILREQLEQKRQESRQKASIQDAKPDFDVSDVLNKAFEMVKPSPSIDGPGAGAPSDSFDENSFYSSRAPDSPQQGDQQKPSSAPPSNSDEPAPEVPAENYSDELQRLEALNRTESDQDMQDTYLVADRRMPYQKQPRPAEAVFTPHTYQEPQPTDAFEEPEYSPPAPGVPPMERGDNHDIPRGYPNGPKRRGPDTRQPDRARYANGPNSPGDDVRVVRNHITSPVAPRPSRVSPLAIAKVPSVHQHKVSRPEYGTEHQASPDAPPQQLMPRKRRRLHEERDRTRPISYRMQAGAPEETYIKEEPVSPPPFADTSPAYRSRPPQERPIYIDVASPRYTPVIERREPPIRDPAYEVDAYDIRGDSGIARTVSRLSTRRPIRDDQDLRRVASLHQARQPEYSREYIDQTSPHAMRAASYAIVEHPPPDRTRYYDEIVPTPTRRYIPAGNSPSSPRYQEAYYDEGPPSRIMAPPTRRIVIDEQGNQYYETVPAPRMQAMPPPSSRMPIPRSEVYDDHQPVRYASVRAPSVLEDPYASRRYVQDMPPPQGAYRRVADFARPAPSERRPYAAPFDEREALPRSASVQVTDYSTRRPPYIEETELPRERIVRMPSVRPPTTRYDEPREVIQRVESVRPAGRDVSVYMDEDPRRPREYVERPVYISARPAAREERYYDSGEPERVVIDGSVHRVPQRY